MSASSTDNTTASSESLTTRDALARKMAREYIDTEAPRSEIRGVNCTTRVAENSAGIVSFIKETNRYCRLIESSSSLIARSVAEEYIDRLRRRTLQGVHHVSLALVDFGLNGEECLSRGVSFGHCCVPAELAVRPVAMKNVFLTVEQVAGAINFAVNDRRGEPIEQAIAEYLARDAFNPVSFVNYCLIYLSCYWDSSEDRQVQAVLMHEDKLGLLIKQGILIEMERYEPQDILVEYPVTGIECRGITRDPASIAAAVLGDMYLSSVRFQDRGNYHSIQAMDDALGNPRIYYDISTPFYKTDIHPSDLAYIHSSFDQLARRIFEDGENCWDSVFESSRGTYAALATRLARGYTGLPVSTDDARIYRAPLHRIRAGRLPRFTGLPINRRSFMSDGRSKRKIDLVTPKFENPDGIVYLGGSKRPKFNIVKSSDPVGASSDESVVA